MNLFNFIIINLLFLESLEVDCSRLVNNLHVISAKNLNVQSIYNVFAVIYIVVTAVTLEIS